MVAMEVAAEKATALPRLGRPRQKLSVQASHTATQEPSGKYPGYLATTLPVRTGDLRFASTLWKNVCPGIPPSLANAYIIRLLDVIENVPQKNIAPMTMT